MVKHTDNAAPGKLKTKSKAKGRKKRRHGKTLAASAAVMFSVMSNVASGLVVSNDTLSDVKDEQHAEHLPSTGFANKGDPRVDECNHDETSCSD